MIYEIIRRIYKYGAPSTLMNLFLIIAINLCPAIGAAQSIFVTNVLQDLRKGEPWDKSILSSTKMVMFKQSASGGTDANVVAKIRLSYFTSTDCSGAVSGSGSYTTPNGTSFSISLGTAFGLVAASAWNVGSTQLSITDMTTINSIAVTLMSTNSDTPQANFSGLSFACILVTCTAGPSGVCTSGSSTQSFTLKTTAAVGDPADGGVIGCQSGGSGANIYNLITAIADGATGTTWGPTNVLIGSGAQSTSDGATNTANIVACLTGPGGGGGCPQNISTSAYAAGICSTYTAKGGYTSGWFLPSGGDAATLNTQLNCIYGNKSAIATGSIAAGGSGFNSISNPNTSYWSSTEVDTSHADRQSFGSTSTRGSILKSNATVTFRCVRQFTS